MLVVIILLSSVYWEAEDYISHDNCISVFYFDMEFYNVTEIVDGRKRVLRRATIHPEIKVGQIAIRLNESCETTLSVIIISIKT